MLAALEYARCGCLQVGEPAVGAAADEYDIDGLALYCIAGRLKPM